MADITIPNIGARENILGQAWHVYLTERGEESLAFRATIVAIEEDEITFVVSDDDVDAFGEERSREILSEELATRLND